MENHRAAATLLLIASLFVAVAISGADARHTVRLDAHGQGYLADAAASTTVSEDKPTCDECEAPEPPTCDDSESPKPEPTTCDECESPKPEPTTGDECESPKPEPTTCDTCESPKPEPTTCDTCESPKPEPKSELTCNKVHGVKEGETCYCLAQGHGLTLDDFLGFNPNICCENLFIGQWVCLEAKSGCED